MRTRHYNARHTLFTPDDTRVEVFGCSCCPPNVVRTIASIADFQYTADADTIWMHQYFSSDAQIDGKTVQVQTAYPYDGSVKITYLGKPGHLALRIPGWCRGYTISVGGKSVTPEIRTGYAYLSVAGGDEIMLRMEMPVRFVEANPRVWDDAGRVAVMRGPLVYCMEGVAALRRYRRTGNGAYQTDSVFRNGKPRLDRDDHLDTETLIHIQLYNET